MAGYLFPWRGEEELQRWRDAFDMKRDGAAPQDHPQAVPISFNTLSPEERQEILMALYRGREEELQKGYDTLAAQTRSLLMAFFDEGLAPPEPLRAPAEYILVCDLDARLREWLSDGDADASRALLALADEARRLGLRDKGCLLDLLSGSLITRMRHLRGHPDLEAFKGVQEIVDLANRLSWTLEQGEVISLMDEILTHEVPPLIDQLLPTGTREQYDLVDALLRLGERLGFATGGLRQHLRPIEERLAADPGLWP